MSSAGDGVGDHTTTPEVVLTTPSGAPETPPPPPRPYLGEDPALFRDNFADSLEELRAGAELTLVALAARPGLKSKSTIWNYLTKKKFPAGVWVDAFVAACLSRYRLDERQLKVEQAIWKAAWRQAQRQQITQSSDSLKPTEPETPKEEPRQGENLAVAETTNESPLTQETKSAQPDSFLRVLFREVVPICAAMRLVASALVLFFFGDVSLKFSVEPNRSTTKPPSLPIPPASSTEPPVSEATITLMPWQAFDPDHSSVLDKKHPGGSDIVRDGVIGLRPNPPAYFAVLRQPAKPQPVKPERHQCENAGYETEWFQSIVEADKLPVGARICVYTN